MGHFLDTKQTYDYCTKHFHGQVFVVTAATFIEGPPEFVVVTAAPAAAGPATLSPGGDGLAISHAVRVLGWPSGLKVMCWNVGLNDLQFPQKVEDTMKPSAKKRLQDMHDLIIEEQPHIMFFQDYR